MARVKRKVKTIRIDADKCNGCRSCEVICSASHAIPRWSSVNPARSRIHVTTHRLKDIWFPVFAGEYVAAECTGRDIYTINGKEYDECGLCRAACPSRDRFKEPDSGLPLKCDMCEGVDEDQPLCVTWCLDKVLTYEEREVEVEAPEDRAELDIGLQALADRFGTQKLLDTVARMAKKG